MKYYSLALLSFALLTIPFKANASISVTPQDIKLDVSANDTHQASFTVNNTSDMPVNVSIKLTDWMLTQSGEFKYSPAGSLKQSCADWIRINPVDFLLAPKASQQVAYTINTPSKMTGSYWGMIDVGSSPVSAGSNEQGVAIQVALTIGMQVILKDPQSTEHTAELIGIEIIEPTETRPRRVAVNVKNSNNGHVFVLGKFEIRDMSGNIVAREETAYRFLVFPYSSRTFQHPLKTKLPQGTYNILAIMDYGEDDLIAGETTFEVS